MLPPAATPLLIDRSEDPAPAGPAYPRSDNCCGWEAISAELNRIRWDRLPNVTPGELWDYIWSSGVAPGYHGPYYQIGSAATITRSAQLDGRLDSASISQIALILGVTIEVHGRQWTDAGNATLYNGEAPARVVVTYHDGHFVAGAVGGYGDVAMPAFVGLPRMRPPTNACVPLANKLLNPMRNPGPAIINGLASFQRAHPSEPSLGYLTGLRVLPRPLTRSINRNAPPAALPSFDYHPNRQRAKMLLRDLTSNPDQILPSPKQRPAELCQSLKSMVDEFDPDDLRTVSVLFSAGVPGSGKSRGASAYLAQLAAHPDFDPNLVRVMSPNPLLRLQVEANFPIPNGQGYNYPSGLTLLHENFHGTLIVDEIGKFVPGTLDLILFANPGIHSVYMTGDQTQQNRLFPNGDACSRTLAPETTHFSPYCGYYKFETNRLAIGVAAVLGIPTTSTRNGSISFIESPIPGLPVLAASPRFVNVLAHGGHAAISYEDAQGLEFDGDYCIDFGGLSMFCTNESVWTLLTRGKSNVYIVDNHSYRPGAINDTVVVSSIMVGLYADAHVAQGPLDEITMTTTPRFTRAFCHRFMACHLPEHLIRGSDLEPQRLINPTGGKVQGPPVRVSGGVPDFMQLHAAFAPNPKPREFLEPKSRRPLPIAQVWEPSRWLDWDELDTKESRELYSTREDCITDQVREGAGDDRIPLRHRRRDRATEAISLAARIRVSTFDANDSRFRRARDRGEKLIRGFLNATDFVPTTFNQELFEQCQHDAQDIWLGDRTVANLARASAANDPDWDPKFTKLFLKGQTINKPEAQGGRAKKGQIITTFPLSSVLAEAPYALLVERVVLSMIPKNVYLHCRKSFDQLRAWYSDHWDPSEDCTANDYTGWDTGVDEAFLYFDRWLMRSCGLPEEFIESYTDRKLHTRCFLGPMPVMQHSGDRWTWLLNTLRNIAITHEKFDIPRGMPQAYSGDDMNLCGRPSIRPRFDPDEWLLKGRTTRSPVEPFCGFEFGRLHLTVNARQMAGRMRVALADGSPPDVWVNYMDLLTHVDIPDGDAAQEDLAVCLSILQHAAHHAFRPASTWPSVPAKTKAGCRGASARRAFPCADYGRPTDRPSARFSKYIPPHRRPSPMAA